MKKLLSIILTIALVMGILVLPVNAIEIEPLNEAPTIPTEGDVWDGSILQPSKLVTKNGVTYYEITKCAELAYVAQIGGDWLGYNYILGNNLILNDVVFTWDEEGNLINAPEVIATLHEWVPIGSASEHFTGVFHGAGYTISGLYIQSEGDRVGLFGYAEGESISHFDLTNLHIVGQDQTGSVGGFISSLVSQIKSSGVVRGNGHVGGIVGSYKHAKANKITNCVNYCIVISSEESYAAGIAGYTYGDIQNSANYGMIRGKDSVGGITGKVPNSFTVLNCNNYGAIHGDTKVGGIVADADWCPQIQGCVNSGEIRCAVSSAGGIVGWCEEYVEVIECLNTGNVYGENLVGGIAGYVLNSRKILQSGNTGAVRGNTSVGGIAGSILAKGGNSVSTVNISYTYNLGSVSGISGVGGISGEGKYAAITQAYSLGAVSGTESTGTILGDSDHIWGRSTITDCYYSKDSGVNESLYAFGNRSQDGSVAGDAVGVAEARTLAELKQQTTFMGWDFTGTSYSDPIWAISPTHNGGYPYLYWQSFDDAPIPVNGITLDKTELALAVGDYAYLTTSVAPATATDKTVKWTSDTPTVAMVSAAGKVEAISAGTAILTATSADGKHSATCTVTVRARVANEYELKKLSLRDSSGDQISAIPKADFWATVAIKNLASAGNSMVLLASYDSSGRYLGMNAAWVEDVPVGSTVNVSFLFSNSNGKIAEIKAFCVASFSNLTPLGGSLPLSK